MPTSIPELATIRKPGIELRPRLPKSPRRSSARPRTRPRDRSVRERGFLMLNLFRLDIERFLRFRLIDLPVRGSGRFRDCADFAPAVKPGIQPAFR